MNKNPGRALRRRQDPEDGPRSTTPHARLRKLRVVAGLPVDEQDGGMFVEEDLRTKQTDRGLSGRVLGGWVVVGQGPNDVDVDLNLPLPPARVPRDTPLARFRGARGVRHKRTEIQALRDDDVRIGNDKLKEDERRLLEGGERLYFFDQPFKFLVGWEPNEIPERRPSLLTRLWRRTKVIE